MSLILRFCQDVSQELVLIGDNKRVRVLRGRYLYLSKKEALKILEENGITGSEQMFSDGVGTER